jgi:aspartate-semialdehyde dehydrogenase
LICFRGILSNVLYSRQIPEINAHKLKGAKLVANPNCTTAIAAVVLHPIIQECGIKKLIMSTYQAASGAGIEVILKHFPSMNVVLTLKYLGHE